MGFPGGLNHQGNQESKAICFSTKQPKRTPMSLALRTYSAGSEKSLLKLACPGCTWKQTVNLLGPLLKMATWENQKLGSAPSALGKGSKTWRCAAGSCGSFHLPGLELLDYLFGNRQASVHILRAKRALAISLPRLFGVAGSKARRICSGKHSAAGSSQAAKS